MAARPRTGTNGCTSRSSAPRAADAAAWAKEHPSRETACPQPFSLDPDRPLAPSEGSNDGSRDTGRAARGGGRERAPPRSSSGRPTPRESRQRAPLSALRRSRKRERPEVERPSGSERQKRNARLPARKPRKGPMKTGTTARGRATAGPPTRRRAAGGAEGAAAAEGAADAAGPGRVRPPMDPTPRPTRPSAPPGPARPSGIRTRPTPSSAVARAHAREEAGAAWQRGNANRPRRASVRTPSRTKPPTRTAPSPEPRGSAGAAAAAAGRDPARAQATPPTPPRKRRRSPSAPGAREPSRSRWHRAGPPAVCGPGASEAGDADSGNRRSRRRGSRTSSW